MSGRIEVLGLGFGSEEGLSLAVLRRLKEHRGKLFLRTKEHPIIPFLQREGVDFTTFDSIYEAHGNFEAVYRHIADRLLDEAEAGGETVLYAVPGHPGVAEMSVRILRQESGKRQVDVKILPGASFLEAAFARLPLDPVDGFALLDGSALDIYQVNPRLDLLITQVYSRQVASDVKLTLMEVYPDEFSVVVANALGVEGAESVCRVPLYQLDWEERFGHLTLLWLPRAEATEVLNGRFGRLHEVVATLRSPQGCPWDREQTHLSLRRYLVEETAEVLDSLDREDPQGLEEELGDLLLQVMLHAQIATESGDFGITDVIRTLNEKLVRRHPHVFAEVEADSSEEVNRNWQQIKELEKKEKGILRSSLLDSVPLSLPALAYAEAVQKRAAEVGFDWSDFQEVVGKVREELAEVEEASVELQAEELGDLLFAAVNLCRFCRVEPEAALAQANQKFMRRFRHIERVLEKERTPLEETGLERMEELWQQAKRLEKSR